MLKFRQANNSLTLRPCPGCKANKRLYAFRRWRGDKRVLHDVCNTCAGATKPEIHVYLEKVREEQHAQHLSQRKRERVLRINDRKRKANWHKAITHRLIKEHEWAARLRDTTHVPVFEEFFRTYAQVLHLMLDRVKTQAARRTGPLHPTSTDANPWTYTSPGAVATLRWLYARCGEWLMENRGSELSSKNTRGALSQTRFGNPHRYRSPGCREGKEEE